MSVLKDQDNKSSLKEIWTTEGVGEGFSPVLLPAYDSLFTIDRHTTTGVKWCTKWVELSGFGIKALNLAQ